MPKKRKLEREEFVPFSQEYEEAVIGALLIDSELLPEIKEKLVPDDFFYEPAKYCYQACLELDKKGMQISQLTIAHQLNEINKLTEIGGAAYLSHVVANCVDPYMAPELAKQIKELSLRRQLLNCITVSIADLTRKSWADTLGKIEDALHAFKQTASIKTFKSTFSNLTIIESQPRKYRILVTPPGQSIVVGKSELKSTEKIHDIIWDRFDYMPDLPPYKEWRKMIQGLMENAEKETAPLETKEEFEFKEAIMDCFETKGEGKEVSDLKAGCYVMKELVGDREFFLFMPSSILKWLRERGQKLSPADLWVKIKSIGGLRDVSIRLSENSRKVWALPKDFAEEHKEEDWDWLKD